jgi:hypothetical protein
MSTLSRHGSEAEIGKMIVPYIGAQAENQAMLITAKEVVDGQG